MQLLHSHQIKAAAMNPAIASLLHKISEPELRAWVRHLSRPRHFLAEPSQNRATAAWLAEQLRGWNYAVQETGATRNVVAIPQDLPTDAPVTVVGAHFDSVPGSPGADDNASAVAALLGAASTVAGAAVPVIFVAFNREEDGFLGSREFVEEFLPGRSHSIACAHILEMVGYASDARGSQQRPTGLPIQLPEAGNFLGLLSNDQSAEAMRRVLEISRAFTPDLPVIGLAVVPGAERAFPVLARSDHVPFWSRHIPAVMWTDTAEFRNPNYHQVSDTPDTLNYPFLKQVTRLLAATIAG
jgi:Zn-dependent M28 family amino/carboxypeptidase